jgi:hypothetical protein
LEKKAYVNRSRLRGTGLTGIEQESDVSFRRSSSRSTILNGMGP